MPRSRLIQAMNQLRNELVVLGGKKVAWLALTMLVEKMRPLIVPTDTVRFSTIKSTTRTIPAKAMTGTQSKAHRLAHPLHVDVPKT